MVRLDVGPLAQNGSLMTSLLQPQFQLPHRLLLQWHLQPAVVHSTTKVSVQQPVDARRSTMEQLIARMAKVEYATVAHRSAVVWVLPTLRLHLPQSLLLTPLFQLQLSPRPWCLQPAVVHSTTKVSVQQRVDASRSTMEQLTARILKVEFATAAHLSVVVPLLLFLRQPLLCLLLLHCQSHRQYRKVAVHWTTKVNVQQLVDASRYTMERPTARIVRGESVTVAPLCVDVPKLLGTLICY